MEKRIGEFEHQFKNIPQPYEIQCGETDVDNGWSVSLDVVNMKHHMKSYTLSYWGIDKDFPNPFTIELSNENGSFAFDTGYEWTLIDNAWLLTASNEDPYLYKRSVV